MFKEYLRQGCETLYINRKKSKEILDTLERGTQEFLRWQNLFNTIQWGFKATHRIARLYGWELDKNNIKYNFTFSEEKDKIYNEIIHNVNEELKIGVKRVNNKIEEETDTKLSLELRQFSMFMEKAGISCVKELFDDEIVEVSPELI